MSRRGFTLLELMMSLTLTFVIILAGFGFFGQAHRVFFKLKAAVDDSQDALAAMDKIRIDIMRAGRGLAFQGGLSLLEVAATEPPELVILREDGAFRLDQDVGPGDERAGLQSTDGLKAGTDICFTDPGGCEIREVLRIEGNFVIIGAPLGRAYGQDSSRVLALEKISYFLDGAGGVIRRRVDSGGAQPLIEGVESFLVSYDKPANLVSVSFALVSRKDKPHELHLFPKNIGLSPRS